MCTIDKLYNCSFCYIVDILDKLGCLEEFVTRKGFRSVSLTTFDGEEKVLCSFGDMCTNKYCTYHHLHEDPTKIFENYRLCHFNERCYDENCAFRHTNRCADLMDKFDYIYNVEPDRYDDFIARLASLIAQEEGDYEDDDFDAVYDPVFVEDIINMMWSIGDEKGLDALKDQGVNVYI